MNTKSLLRQDAVLKAISDHPEGQQVAIEVAKAIHAKRKPASTDIRKLVTQTVTHHERKEAA